MAELRRAFAPVENHRSDYLANLSMRKILVMTSAYARTDCRGGDWEAGSLWGRAIFLGGKSRGSVAFGNRHFSGGKSYY